MIIQGRSKKKKKTPLTLHAHVVEKTNCEQLKSLEHKDDLLLKVSDL